MQELCELKSTQTPFIILAKLIKQFVKVLSPSNMTPWKPDNFLYHHPHLLSQKGKLRLRKFTDLTRASQLVPSLGASLRQGPLCLPHPALGQTQSRAREKMDE